MSIVSVPFLFLFLPLGVGIYYLIPAKKSLTARNVFLVLISLFFYAWGELTRVLLLCALMVAAYILGVLVDGKKGTKKGKLIVFIAVMINVGALFVYKYLDFTLANIGILIGQELPTLGFTLPLGLSFFCFQAISYVVDIYRGKVKSPRNFLSAVLFLSLFFKVTQGPITQYNQLEAEISSRKSTWDLFSRGIWKFVLGLAKKVIIASNVSFITTRVFAADPATLPVASAWLGCFTYMIQVYFDFAGYSDMAIGLGMMFGFEIPENFNYPYIATSVTEYWQRWHISLGSWFRDYMFYPLTLGPAIRMRKFFAKKKVNKETAKFIQNVFVVGTIWFTTGIWHGAKWNYMVWGLINGVFVIWELYKKPLKNAKLDSFLGWLYSMAVVLLTKAIVCTPDMKTAVSFFGAMFGAHGNVFSDGMTVMFIKEYWMFLLMGVLASFPIYTKLKERFVRPEMKKTQAFLRVAEAVALFAVFIVSLGYVFRAGYTAFIYQKF